MRKQIFTLCMLTLFVNANAQKNLRQLIQGERNISERFTKIPEANQVSFEPNNAARLLGLDPSSDLVLQNTETDKLGFTHYRYVQTFKGIPVENSMYILHAHAGKLTELTGDIVTEFNTTTASQSMSSLSESQAIAIATNYVNATQYAWQSPDMEKSFKSQRGTTTATYFPTPSLVWYNPGDEIIPRELKLAYKVDIYATEPLSRAYYFVDAQSGAVLGKKDEIFYTDAPGTANTAYSGVQNITSNEVSVGSYQLRDLSKGSGVITLHGESGSKGTNYTSTSATWTLTGKSQAAMDAHYGVSQTYSFYLTNLGRDSYDGKGTALTSYVNIANTTDNAYWDGSAMNFGTRSTGAAGGVTGIDVTGHELSHGVTQTTSGLNYSGESGAMNESMSDIMGKSVQFWAKPSDVNWKLSNDMNWFIRDMGNPNAYKQPDTYKGTYWYTGTSDNGGVHTNSGVGNFMFYLLVNGGSGTNDIGNTYNVAGIGLLKADSIIYKTNTTYLTPTSNYAAWRTACINAATARYGATSDEVAAVQNAWYAVGVGAAAGGSTTCSAPSGLVTSNVTSTGATLGWASTGATSYNLQWKASAASVWTTVTGISTTSYTLSGLTAGTDYQFQVQSVCSGSTSAYSAAATFTTATAGGTITYCASKGTSTTYEYIKTVSIGTINNTSNSNSGYGNYTSLSTALTAGASKSIVLTPGFTGSAYREYWTVYIDYNADGDFADAGEQVTTGNGTGAITSTFTVPATAKNGATRMRIQMHFGSLSTGPCATLDYGEVEDYTVNISGGAAIEGFIVASDNMKAAISISPNPIAGSVAKLSYTLPTPGRVTIRIIDMLGRAVQTISQGEQTAGNHTYNLADVKKYALGNYFAVIVKDNAQLAKTAFIINQ